MADSPLNLMMSPQQMPMQFQQQGNPLQMLIGGGAGQEQQPVTGQQLVAPQQMAGDIAPLPIDPLKHLNNVISAWARGHMTPAQVRAVAASHYITP